MLKALISLTVALFACTWLTANAVPPPADQDHFSPMLGTWLQLTSGQWPGSEPVLEANCAAE